MLVKIKDLNNFDVYVIHGDVRQFMVGGHHFELNNPNVKLSWTSAHPEVIVRVVGKLELTEK